MENKPSLWEMLDDVLGSPIAEDYPLHIAVYELTDDGKVSFVPPLREEHERYLRAYRQILGAIALMGIIDADLLFGIGSIAAYVPESDDEPPSFEIAYKSEPVASSHRMLVQHVFHLIANTPSRLIFVTSDAGETQQGLGVGLTEMVNVMRSLGCFGD